ncbi:hypothetical protein [Streptomyces thermolineatus]|uniref:hypothetical protein n=1 Tax=Streptomyces thermolineatus TaxID=44033 RepID=UPI00384AA318
MITVDIELDPPNGITGFPLGMPAEAVKAAAARLGRIKVPNDGSADRFRHMKVLALHEQFEIVFLSLGLTRVAGHDAPLDTDGEPLYFQAVLTGPADYYDFLLASR